MVVSAVVSTVISAIISITSIIERGIVSIRIWIRVPPPGVPGIRCIAPFPGIPVVRIIKTKAKRI
jgi:hypothetical protein